MMRGVSTWAVAVRKPLPEQIADGRAARRPRRPPRGDIEVQSVPARRRGEPAAVCSAAGDPRRRRARRVAQIGIKALGISANAQLDRAREEISGKMWGCTIFLGPGVRDRPVLRAPRRHHQPLKDKLGSAVLFVARREAAPHLDLPRLPVALSHIKDLRRVFEYHGAEHKVISCYEAGEPLEPENAQQLLPPAPALRHELPADRDDHRHLRVRPDRAARLVHPGRHPHRRHAADRGPVLRGHPLGRAQPAKPWVRSVMWPGLQLQKLTTREPDLDQLAVAFAALEAVLAVEDPRAASRGLASAWKSWPKPGSPVGRADPVHRHRAARRPDRGALRGARRRRSPIPT